MGGHCKNCSWGGGGGGRGGGIMIGAGRPL